VEFRLVLQNCTGGHMPKFVLCLYISGRTIQSDAAIGNLRRICERDLGAEYELEVIDVLEHPKRAEDEKILATPTVVRVLPLPMRKYAGDLSDRAKVLLDLDIPPLNR
jgi:circadian clock protein KaiB